MTTFRSNVKKIVVSFFNSILSMAFFFNARKLLLNASGANIGPGVTIHRKVIFYTMGKLHVGKNSTINPWCIIDNRGGIFIGNNVNISHSVRIYSAGHDIEDPAFLIKVASVYISDNAWIFPNAIIMPGVSIGEGAVIYPGSVVTKKVGAYEIWGGNPARLIRMRKNDIKYDASYPVWLGI